MEFRTSAYHGAAVPPAERGAGDAAPELDEAQVWRPRARDGDAESATAWSAPVSSDSASSDTASWDTASNGSDDRPPPWISRGRGRRGFAAVAALLVAAALYGLASLGPVRTVLSQSFTQLSSPTVQFYLNGNPWIAGQFVNVPLGVILQNGPSSTSYRVHVWTVNAGGKQDASTTVTLPVHGGRGAANFSLPIPADAQLVWAQIVGTSLSVHYRFAGSAVASATGPR